MNYFDQYSYIRLHSYGMSVYGERDNILENFAWQIDNDPNITPYTWRMYRDLWDPPLRGPNDFRVLKLEHKLSPTIYETLIGIPKLLKQEKYLQQRVELDESLLYVLPNGQNDILILLD